MPSERATAVQKNGGSRARLLIVEDEFLLAMDLEERLVGMGYRVLGLAGTLDHAHRLLDQGMPDGALLDINLGGTMVTPVAERLLEAKVPYIVTTAYSRSNSDPPVLAEAPRLTKPLRDNALERALSDLLP